MSVSKLNEELVKAGVSSEVYTTTANGENEINIQPGSKVLVDGVPVTYFRRITKGNSHLSPSLLLSLWKELKKRRDTRTTQSGTTPQSLQSIIHVHAWWNLVSVGSCIICLLLSQPVILSPRGTLSNYSFRNRKGILKNLFHLFLGKRLLKRSHFHVSTEKEKQDIINILTPRSITVISNFVNLHDIKSNLNTMSKLEGPVIFKLLFLSRVEEKKGLNILFNALKLVNIPWHLTIAGTGTSEYISFLKDSAEKLGLTGKISWIGHQDAEQKFQILMGHHLLVLPSHDESFANVVIESLAVGTPVLVSSKVGLADYVVANNLGWTYENTHSNLATALAVCFYDEEKRSLIKKQGPMQISADFNESRLILEYLELYKKVILQEKIEKQIPV